VRVSRFVYVVTLAPGFDRDGVIRRLEAQGVPARAYFSPVHLQPYLRDRLGGRDLALPVTEDLARRTLALPFHNNLTEAEVERVVAALRRAVEE
jgi:perosamine synthetase